MKQNTSFSFWGFVISALVLVFFAVQNAQEVTFKFFVWKTHLSLSVLLIVAFLLGLIAGAIFSFRKSKSSEKQQPKKENIEKESFLPNEGTEDSEDEKTELK